MKRFSFIYISLAILLLTSIGSSLSVSSVRPLSAAPNNEEYQNLILNTDNETQYEHTGMQFSEEQMRQFLYDYYSAPFEGYNGRAIPKTSGPVLLFPANGSTNLPIDWIIFSWTPFKENTKYIFVLASDAAIETHIISMRDVTIANYPYKYDRTLDYNTVYFWQVMALDPTKSDWSSIFSFRTEAAAPPAASPPPPLPEVPPKPSSLPITSIVIMIITLAVAVGLVTWLLVSRHRAN